MLEILINLAQSATQLVQTLRGLRQLFPCMAYNNAKRFDHNALVEITIIVWKPVRNTWNNVECIPVCGLYTRHGATYLRKNLRPHGVIINSDFLKAGKFLNSK